MNPILLAVIFVTAIGLLCAIMLVLAAKFMAVKVDERVTEVREVLPGANCGACGYPGCDGYAAALVEDGAEPILCTPGGSTVAAKISSILGVEVGEIQKKVAVIACLGDCDATKDKLEYHGIETCAAANLIFGGKGSCVYGCLGLGDCAVVCPEDAICLEKGIAHIDPRACIGCGLCVKACPKNLIHVGLASNNVVVTCSSHDKGVDTKKKCSHGCIACRKCVKTCPAEAITVENNLAVIDYDKCTNCGACAEVCMAGCIMDKAAGAASAAQAV